MTKRTHRIWYLLLRCGTRWARNGIPGRLLNPSRDICDQAADEINRQHHEILRLRDWNKKLRARLVRP